MNNFDIQQLIKNIQAEMRCPRCQSHYKKEDIVVLGCINNACLVHLDCGICGNSLLATIMINSQISKKIPGSKEQIPSKEPLNSDDIINLHQFLKDFNGDFKKIFGDNK